MAQAEEGVPRPSKLGGSKCEEVALQRAGKQRLVFAFSPATHLGIEDGIDLGWELGWHGMAWA